MPSNESNHPMVDDRETVPHREYARVKTHLYGRIDTLKARAERAEAVLLTLVAQHHSTIVESRLHDPENQSWGHCPCKTCLAVAEILPEQAEDARDAFDRPQA